jgi:hypothetical protein
LQGGTVSPAIRLPSRKAQLSHQKHSPPPGIHRFGASLSLKSGSPCRTFGNSFPSIRTRTFPATGSVGRASPLSGPQVRKPGWLLTCKRSLELACRCWGRTPQQWVFSASCDSQGRGPTPTLRSRPPEGGLVWSSECILPSVTSDGSLRRKDPSRRSIGPRNRLPPPPAAGGRA